MALSGKMVKELRYITDTLNNSRSKILDLQEDVCLFIQDNKFSDLISKFKWQPYISSAISQIIIDEDNIKTSTTFAIHLAVDAFKSEIRALVSEIEMDFGEVKSIWDFIENSVSPELKKYLNISEEFLDKDEIASKYGSKTLEFYNEVEEYIEDNLAHDSESVYLHNNTLHISYYKDIEEVIHMSARFDNKALYDWIEENTVVQDGHLEFIG